MIRLIDVLKLQGIELGRYKIHLATTGSGGSSPLAAYWGGTFKEWQEDQGAKNFQCETIISLISRGSDQWLFAGVYRVLGVESKNSRFIYKTEIVHGEEGLAGRIIVRYKRPFRNSYIWGHKYGGGLMIGKLQEIPFNVQDFRGFNKVRVSHDTLKLIIQVESWKTALSSVGGVYLVMDRKTGKGYVGIAYGAGGIWQRWCNYAETGHGGNVDLLSVLEVEGPEYAKNFQYAILEIADLLDTHEQVLERESHWKSVLMTRKSEFGYNLN